MLVLLVAQAFFDIISYELKVLVFMSYPRSTLGRFVQVPVLCLHLRGARGVGAWHSFVVTQIEQRKPPREIDDVLTSFRLFAFSHTKEMRYIYYEN